MPADDLKVYIDGLLALDAMRTAGEGESPEVNNLRDRMDAPWRRLSAAEQEEVRLLGAGG
jgi:hypothetical protein